MDQAEKAARAEATVYFTAQLNTFPSDIMVIERVEHNWRKFLPKSPDKPS